MTHTKESLDIMIRCHWMNIYESMVLDGSSDFDWKLLQTLESMEDKEFFQWHDNYWGTGKINQS